MGIDKEQCLVIRSAESYRCRPHSLSRINVDDLVAPLIEDIDASGLGLRNSDQPPAGLERQPRYGATIPGADAAKSFEATRKERLAAPVRPDQPAPPNRLVRPAV